MRYSENHEAVLNPIHVCLIVFFSQAKLALLSCHHILICLGDIERYQGQFHTTQNWASIRSWYLKANKLAPKNGKPYNQLGVIAVLANRKLDSVYYYIRSLTASNPILTAREKLTAIFYDIQKKVMIVVKSIILRCNFQGSKNHIVYNPGQPFSRVIKFL